MSPNTRFECEDLIGDVSGHRTATPERAALRYAELGYRVLTVWPLENGRCTCEKGKMCKTPGKHPIMKGWEQKASTDPDKISKWFKRHPNAHVGIMPLEGHCIIDVDPRNGGKETIQKLIGNKVPKTVIQESGGGGYHLFFDGEPNGPIGDGIDIKREGRGFVVAWPSAHESGGSYRWRNAPWDVEEATLPKALAGTPRTPREHDLDDIPPSYPIDLIRAALAHVDADDYARWINIGQALRHAYGDDGQELWEQWSKTSSKYGEGDEAKWDTFDQNRDRPLITIRSVMAIARRNGYRPLGEEFQKGFWAIGAVDRYVDQPAPPLQWAYEPCVPRGKVCLLAGAGGTSKSYLTVTLAMQMAIGESFGPFKPSCPGKALILTAEEDEGDIHRRIQSIIKSRMFDARQLKDIKNNVGIVSLRGKDFRLLFRDSETNLQETERVNYIIDEVRAIGDCRFLVIDPLVAFNGGMENANEDMARLMFALDRIARETNCGVLVVHHANKSGQGASLDDVTQGVIRGASALVDNARAAVILLRMPRGAAALFNIKAEDAGRFIVCRFVKNNYGPYRPDTVFAVEHGGVLRHAPEIKQVYRVAATAAKDDERKFEQERVRRGILCALFENGGTLSQRKVAKETGVGRNKIKEFLDDLREDGHVRQAALVGRDGRWELTELGRKELQRDDGRELL
jgi:KaiC/GvpD/RAD55 family RecA-like ATPase